MTAHAMRGDRERLLAAGMDDYLSKPVAAQQMLALVQRVAGGASPEPQAAAAVDEVASDVPIESSTAAPVFDPHLAKKRCMNKQDVLDDMVQYFFDDLHKLLPEMHDALDKGDLAELGRLGHRLKGTVSYLGAEPATRAAGRVEHFLLRGGRQVDAENAVRALERECERLKAALTKHRARAAPGT